MRRSLTGELSTSGIFLSSSRVKGGCVSADKVGLLDTQGKVNGKDGAYELVAFFDVHTSSTSGQAKSLGGGYNRLGYKTIVAIVVLLGCYAVC
jgi:hypothetical protein